VTAIPQHIDALESYAHRRGLRLHRAALPECLHGRQNGDQIVVRAGLAPEQELRALVHELTHWLVHGERQLAIQCTIFEYEAEAVETLVMSRLGVTALDEEQAGITESLLRHSVRRVSRASSEICAALGLDRPSGSESQPAVDVDAAAREEIILEDEQHGLRDLRRSAEPT